MSALAPTKRKKPLRIIVDEAFDHRFNPVHKVFGCYGYWIQAHVFQIPDRYGFFTDGPPRHQARQGFLAASLIFHSGIFILLGTLAIWLPVFGSHGLVFVLLSILTLMWAALVMLFWYVSGQEACYKPGYEWEPWRFEEEIAVKWE